MAAALTITATEARTLAALAEERAIKIRMEDGEPGRADDPPTPEADRLEEISFALKCNQPIRVVAS